MHPLLVSHFIVFCMLISPYICLLHRLAIPRHLPFPYLDYIGSTSATTQSSKLSNQCLLLPKFHSHIPSFQFLVSSKVTSFINELAKSLGTLSRSGMSLTYLPKIEYCFLTHVSKKCQSQTRFYFHSSHMPSHCPSTTVQLMILTIIQHPP